MRQISINGVSRIVPQRLAELSPEELSWLIRHLVQGVDDLSLRIHFAARFWNLPIGRINRLGRKAAREKYLPQRLSDVENWLDANSKIYLLAEQFDFLLHDRRLERNPFPVIRLPWYRFRRALHGPDDGLKNLSIWEFAVAERHAMGVRADNLSDALDRFIAALYRPRSILLQLRSVFCWTADQRLPFNDQTYTRRVAAVSRVPMEVKLAVLMFFKSVRDTFQGPELFPHVYSGTQSASQGRKLSWGDVIMEMSGEVPGNEDATGRVNLYTFLYRLELNAIKLEQLERERKSLTP